MSKNLQAGNSRELAFALDICEKAGKVAMRYFNQGVKATYKEDGSPVTKADRECEQLIRSHIEKRFPGDGILGEEEEELPSKNTGKVRRWILDPIDGTYGFARGLPGWSILLALEEEGEPKLGVLHAPQAKELFWAEKGKGAFRNGKRLTVSSLTDLKKAQFNFGGLNRIVLEGYLPALAEIAKVTGRQRAFGDYLSFAQVLEGKAEATLEIGVHPWDVAPMKVLILEAGGCYHDLAGGDSIYTGNCLITNRLLSKQMLSFFQDKARKARRS